MNSVQLIGRLGQEPEIKETNGGKLLAKFSLAVYRTKDETDWVNCEAWEKSAEMIQNYVHKGDQVGVIGRIRQEQWEKEGEKRTSIKVVVNNVSLLANAKKDSSSTSTIVEGEEDEDLPF